VQWRLFWTKTQDGGRSCIQLHINDDRHNWDASLNVKVVHKGFASWTESAVPYWSLLSTPWRHGFTFHLSP